MVAPAKSSVVLGGVSDLITPVRPFYTVVELIESPELQGTRIVAAQEAASARQIRGASVQEVPLQDFVRTDELVMTTAMGLEDPQALAGFVEAVADAGASALAIAVGYHVAIIPNIVVTLAERRELPLIEMPWDLRFSEVVEVVLNRTIDRQHALIRQSERLHDLFTKIVLGGGSLPQLCESVASFLGRPVAVENRWGERIGIDQQDRPLGPDVERMPIVAGSRTVGTLLAERAGVDLSEPQKSVLSHAATAAGLILLIDEAADHSGARDASEFVSAVLNRWADSQTELEHWARRLGVGADDRLVVALGTFSWPNSGWDEQASEAARWAVERTLSSRQIRGLAMWQGADVTLLLPVRSIAIREQLRILAGEVRSLVRRHEPGASISWGLSRIADGLADVRDRYQDARIANRLGGAFNDDDITDFADLGALPALFEAMSSGRVSEALKQLQARCLGPIVECERRTGLELTRTLRSYFDHNGNVSAAARDLGLNRQSMIYRISRIEDLAGVSLTDAGPRFALELALRSWELQMLEGVISAASTVDVPRPVS